MKKLLFVVSAGFIFFTSCKKTETDPVSTPSATETPVTGRRCAAMEVLEQQMKEDPSLRQRMENIENFTRTFSSSAQRLNGDVLEVPVVVNVLWHTTAENLATGQIQSQIDVLNEDYIGTNSDYSQVPPLFSGVKAYDTKIHYFLDTIIRRQTNKTSWGTNDAMKKTKQGGINPTSPATMLNMWACSLGQNLLGYAQFPGGNPATDGVVILNSAFGSRAKYPSGYYISTYDLGRTATHEVGHYFNLRHIWGDANCGNDYIDDTPLHTTANYGCPAYPTRSTCTGTPVMMTMNYMDYTDDACMYMFSAGQKVRMQAVWAVGGPRASMR